MEKLIEVVREFPALYDTTHEGYMKVKLKDDLWEKIAKELHYTDGKVAKEQWRKLRECHREALRRQHKKSGQPPTNNKPWTYQKQMEFLQPFMKNRTRPTVEFPISPHEESLLVGDDDSLTAATETTNDGEPTPKRFKKSPVITDPLTRKFIEDCDKRSRNRDKLSQNLIEVTQKQDDIKNDALYQFFMSMFNMTKVLPKKFQKEVRAKLFQAVSDAEDKAEDEITAKSSE